MSAPEPADPFALAFALDAETTRALTEAKEALDRMLSEIRAELPVSFRHLETLARGMGEHFEHPLFGLATIGFLAFLTRYPEYLHDFSRIRAQDGEDPSTEEIIIRATLDSQPTLPVN